MNSRKRNLLIQKEILMRYHRVTQLGQLSANSGSTLHSPKNGVRIDNDEEDDKKWLELKHSFEEELGIENWNENR